MTVLWIIGGVATLIAIAAVAEAWVKRGKHRPLSAISSVRRRYDDPYRCNTDKNDYVVNVNTHTNSTGETSRKSWSISKDPTEYAKAMMPVTTKGKPRT